MVKSSKDKASISPDTATSGTLKLQDKIESPGLGNHSRRNIDTILSRKGITKPDVCSTHKH